MGDEADADWQHGLVEWGIEDSRNYYRERAMNTYQCWCPIDTRLPNEVVQAQNSFGARQEYARRHRRQVSDIVARRKYDASTLRST